ncbi:MAG TPA: hypothetical protein VME47_17620 [Acetobacteraceae bacterium]|nr:hypothetical protein [Acetobacteraceae bacterium]
MRTILLLATLFAGVAMLAACTDQQMANGKDQHRTAVTDFGGTGGGGGGY